MKSCNQCETVKTSNEFPKTGRKCKTCKAYNLREYRKNNKEYVSTVRRTHRNLNKKVINDQKREWYHTAPGVKEKIIKKGKAKYWANPELYRARQKNYQIGKETANMQSWLEKCMKHAKAGDKKFERKFELDIEFLLQLYKQQDGKCALSGLSMTYQRDDLFAASIDRIDSSLGHIKDNIQLICSALNRAKREYSNQKALDFVEAIKSQSYAFEDFDGFKYPESTKPYTPYKKLQFKEEKLRPIFNKAFVPPTYNDVDLLDDYNRIPNYSLKNYFKNGKWRSHKPENKPWAGKKLVWHFHPHIWRVKTQKKPLISDIWGRDNKIFERTLTNLVEGQTRISLERIIREFVFAGVGVPSQIHVGFAKAVYEHFGCQKGDVVYDPFAGWGGRLLAAASLGLEYDAYELSHPSWEELVRMADFIGYNDSHIIKSDSVGVKPPPGRHKLMFTSPPFGSEEYIGSDHNIDLDKLLRATKSIPLRILHVNKKLLDKLNPSEIIEIDAKNTVGPTQTKEFLAVFK